MRSTRSARVCLAAVAVIAPMLMLLGESGTMSAQGRLRQAPAPAPQPRAVNSMTGERSRAPQAASLAEPARSADAQGPSIGASVTPGIVDIDLRTLPRDFGPGPQRPVRPRRGDGEFLADRASGPDPVVQTQFDPEGRGHGALSSPLMNFDGIVTGSNPHDPALDVGPNHVIQMVNTRFAIFNKAGTLLAGPSDITSIWTAAGAGGRCALSNMGDPIVLYDQLADRWFMSQFNRDSASGPFYLCFAVSRTADPVAGGFFVYQFTVPQFPDYFKVGVWPNGYFVGAQIGANQAWVAAFNRAAMLAGGAANFVQFNVAGLSGPGGALGFDLIIPSDHDGPTAPPAAAPNIFYRQADGNFWGGSDRLDMFSFNVDFAAPGAATFTALPAITTAAFDAALCGFNSFSCVPQPGTAVRLDPINEPPMFPFRYRNAGTHETLVGSFAVDANGADGAGVRWFELRRTGGNWFLQQEGTYAPQPGGAFVHRWMSAIAMDGSQNIGLLYNVSASSGVFPGIRYTGRLVTDPAGTMPQGEETLINGGSSFVGNTRWGDYGSLSIDPADDCTFWGTQEYTGASNDRRTRIGSFRFTTCGAKPDLVVQSITPVPADPTPGQTVNVTVTVRNNGVAAAGPFFIDFYSHLTSAPGPFQIGVFACQPASLAPGATFDCTGNISYASSGTYSMWAQTDTDQQVGEDSETNNVFGPQAITVAPLSDLTVLSIATNPTVPAPGQLTNVTVRVRNDGGRPAGSFFIDFYSHLASAPGPFQIGVIACQPASLAVGATFDCTGNVAYASAGTYSMWAQVDTDQQVNESDETDNVFGPQSITVARTVTVSVADAAAVEATLDTATLRFDRNGSTADPLNLNYTAGGTATPGSDYTALSGSAVIPSGSSFVNVVITPLHDTLLEGSETVIVTLSASPAYVVGSPSAGTATITEGPDLIVQTLNAPTAVLAGQTFNVTVSTRNQGTLPTAGTTTRIWLSLNKVVDAGDSLLVNVSVPGLGANSTNTQTVAVTVPATTPSSKRLLIAQADGFAVQAEANENNNIRTKGITIGPDYIVSNLTSPSSIPAGTAFAVSDSTKNAGAPTAVNTRTRFYLSTDKLLNTATDTFLGERVVPPLNTNQTSSGSTTVTMPAGTPAGIKYIIALADGPNAVPNEVKETNNTRVVQVIVP